jgi:hypothetical protein
MMTDVTVWVPARSVIVAVRIDATLRNRQMARTSEPTGTPGCARIIGDCICP